MAELCIPSEQRTITDPETIRAFLAERRVEFARWDTPASVSHLRDAASLSADDQQRIIDAYHDYIEPLKQDQGYTHTDMIVLNPSTPNLQELLAKFDKLHYHTDDEVRFIFAGEGIFGYRDADLGEFRVKVTAGDFVSIPPFTWHYFTLGASATITAIRFFQDTSGWQPFYTAEHADATA